jgi:SSS family solute:Na+ symporter
VQFVGQAGGAFALGLVVGNPQLVGAVCFVLMGLFFVPIYIRMGVYTMPEFLERRYGPESRMIYAALSIITLIAVRISIVLYAGALVVSEFLGIDSLYLCVFMIGLPVLLYTVIGGLSAVVYCDTIQAAMLLLGGALTLVMGLHTIGGWDVLTSTLDPSMFQLLKPASVKAPDMPWTSVVFGLTLVSIFYCCNDQEVVQRAIGAKNEFHAKMGGIFAGFLKIAALFVIVVPGLIAKVLYPDAMPDRAYTIMILNILPIGVSGLVLTGLLAAIMSLDSAFCATSSIVTIDFYQKFKKNASDKELVLFGRVMGCIVFVLSMLWAPYIQKFGLLYIYLLQYYAYISSPFVACFLFGILSKRVNRAGAAATLTSGLFLGLGLMIARTTPSLKSHLPDWIVNMHFYHLNIWLFLIATATLFGVSYLTSPPTKEQTAVVRLKAAVDVTARPWYADYRLWAFVLFACIIALYIYFK